MKEHVTTAEQIGQVIRESRKDQGFTQVELATISGVGVRFLSELERGKATAEVGLVLRVLRDLGIDVFLKSRGEG